MQKPESAAGGPIELLANKRSVISYEKRLIQAPYPGMFPLLHCPCIAYLLDVLLIISRLHPTASVVGDSVVVNSVRVEVFNSLSSLLLDPFVAVPKRLRVNFSRGSHRQEKDHRTRLGRLHITMPSTLHEEFGSFASDIRIQMISQSFLPSVLDKFDIRKPGSKDLNFAWGNRRGIYQPDSSLAILGRTFLVVECAHSQSAKAVREKARDYILNDTPYPVRFVVAIYIDTLPSRGAKSAVSLLLHLPL